MKMFEKILFTVLLCLMLLPAVQKQFKIFPVKKLQGDFMLAEKPSFSWESWNQGAFQSAFDAWLEDHIGFRNFFVRVNNQIDLSVYGEVHADGVVKGKEYVFYELDYIREYTGHDYIGKYIIDKRMRQLKFVQKHLKEKFNTDLVLVFEPGKAAFLPEFIPDHYLENKKAPTNYQVYVESANRHEINYINWNHWYVHTLKPAAKYPVYTKYGIHWSQYGMTFALDSLIGFIEHTRQIDLREMLIDTLIIESRTRTPDYDIGSALNLMFRLPEHQKFAYPEYAFGSSEGKDFPMVLVVGDSYYWNIFNTKIANNLFKNQAFWYFNNLVYPDTYYDTTRVSDLNLKAEVENQEVIFLMVTGRFLYKFDWGFIRRLYDIYGIRSEYDQVYDIMSQITGYSLWFDNVIAQAEERGIPLEEMLLLNARYLFENQNPDHYLTLRGQEHFEEKIAGDEQWMASIRAKAAEKNIPENEMLRLEAAYVFQTNHPESFDQYQKLQHYKADIKNNPTHLDKVISEADYYCLTLDEMLQIEAERMLHQSR